MSEVQICNQALALLGAELITSLDDNTVEAKLSALYYPTIRDAVQYTYDWTFCIRWADLPQLADPPLSEFENAYQIPNDTLRVLFVGQDYEHVDRNYRIEGDVIVTNSVSCKAQLLTRVEDTSKFSPLFQQALVARLAAELAIPITNSRTLQEQNYAIYRSKMGEAETMDATQGRPRRMRSQWLNRARVAGPRTAGPVV
jgi:hypothetical protein